MSLALVFASLVLGAPGQSPIPETRLKIFIAGSQVGENVYSVLSDGTLKSRTTLKVGPVDEAGDIEFKRGPQGDIVTLSLRRTSKQPGMTEFTLKDGKIHAIVSGKPIDIPNNMKGKLTFGNLHPQLTAYTLGTIKWQPGVPTKVDVLIADAGGAAPATITPKFERVTPAGTGKVYHIDIGPVGLDVAVDALGRVVGEEVPTQKLRFLADGWEKLFEDPLAKYPELSQPTFTAKIERGVKMTTPDGAVLVQDVIRPDAPGKFPVILSRTPYGRGAEAIYGENYARRGYVFIAQDCRGRSDSTGEWDPFVNEERDGKSTLDWIVAQPWSDGNVGMIGGSYGGSVQWAAAVSKHPALKCIIPQVSPPDGMRNIPYDHGTFALWADLWWARIVSGKEADMAQIRQPLPNLKGLMTLPLSKVDDKVLGKNLPFFDRWLSRDRISAWKGYDYTWRLKDIDVPALHISGWWDGDGIGTKLNWAEMRAAGRKNQWLIYGPWTHAFNTTSKLGDVDYGAGAILELESLYLRWFDTWLKGKHVGLDRVPHVQAFVTGANKWVSLTDWPAPAAVRRTLFLSSKGRLTEKPLPKDPVSAYTYDPAKDTIPKELSEMKMGDGNTKVEDLDKPGVLVFRSAPLDRAMAITGPYDVKLSFRTSARDTDFFVNLIDIAPNGEKRIFGQSGKIRASYIAGYDKPRPLTPNRLYVAHVLPWDSAHELKAGHRLGLVLTSTSFPIYARNLGTGEPILNATKMVVQRNTILHDAIHPSSVSFHVLW